MVDQLHLFKIDDLLWLCLQVGRVTVLDVGDVS